MSENKTKESKDNRVVRWLKANFCYYMPAVIVSIIMLVIFIVERITPFGPNSLTIVDSIHQYVPFFSDYRDKLLNGDSLLYSWDIALGSNFLSLAAYYLSSPFNLLLLLVSQEHIVAAACGIVALKIALSGSAMAYYLGKTRALDSDETDTTRVFNLGNVYIIGLALAYALSNYVVGYYWNTMWMDCIMIFPLIMLGFRKLMEEHKPLMYFLTLFYALFCNYYIGFMICIFLVLWFFVYNHGGIKRFFTDGIKFALCSLIAGAMSAFLLIPAYLGISSTASAKLELPKWTWYGSFAEIFRQQLVLTTPITNQNFDGGVNLYCGMLVVFALMLFFFVRSIKISEKIKTLLLLGVLALSFNNTLLNYIWHGFHDQYGIPNRFSFLYIFVLINVAYKVLEHIDEIKPIYMIIALILALGGITACYISDRKSPLMMATVVSLLLVFAYALVFLLRGCRSISRDVFSMIIASIVLVEMVFSGVYGFLENGYADYDGRYNTSPQVMAAYKWTEDMKTPEDGFYRTELMDSTVLDEATWYNMRSVGTFCSTVLGDLVTTMGKLGFYTGANEFLYMGNTPFTNSLLNVRYVFKRPDDLNNHNFKYVNTVDGVDVYENPYPLSIGFAVNRNVKDWDWSGVERMNLQNNLMYDMTGLQGPFNMQYPEIISSSDNCDVSINKNVITFTPRESGKVSHVEAFTVQSDGDYYVNCRGNHITKIRFCINGEEYAYDRYQIQIFHLGDLKKGDYVTVEYVYENAPSDTTTAVLAIAKFDERDYESVYRVLSSHMLENVEYDEGYVKGTIDMPVANTLFTSIPYDEGWRLKVDGQDAEYYKLMGAFIGIDIEPGVHTIELKYIPRGLKTGIYISVLAWLLMTLISFCMPMIGKKRIKSANTTLTEN